MSKVNLLGGGKHKKRLQGIGECAGILASDLQVGMGLLWNYGSKSTVLAITAKGKQSLIVTEKYGNNQTYNRTIRKDSIVAAFWPQPEQHQPEQHQPEQHQPEQHQPEQHQPEQHRGATRKNG